MSSQARKRVNASLRLGGQAFIPADGVYNQRHSMRNAERSYRKYIKSKLATRDRERTGQTS